MSSQPVGHLVKQTAHLAYLCLSKPVENTSEWTGHIGLKVTLQTDSFEAIY